jgi:hypothetical protein
MSAIRYAINEVLNTIPRAVLQKTFLRSTLSWAPLMDTNLEEQIESRVIRQRVIPTSNIKGGTMVLIPLMGLPYEIVRNSELVMRIPKRLTQERKIMTVLHVSFVNNGGGMATPGMGYGNGNVGVNSVGGYVSDASATMAAAAGMLNALDKIPVTSTANAQLIGENTILVNNCTSMTGNPHLRCMVAYDDELSDINSRSYSEFSELVILATKAFIYKELVIDIDESEIRGGYNLGVFKEIVTGYSEADQNYKDYVKNTWQAVMFMNDKAAYRRFIKSNVGSYT